jgi:hypothetical protein
MRGERKLIRKIALGGAAGLTSVAIIYILNRSGLYIAWAPIIAAVLIGAVAGIAENSGKKIALGLALGGIGWFCGELLSRQLFHSAITWVCVGGFIGLTAGILEKSPKSIIGGLLLGVLGGALGMLARFSPVAVDAMANVDMQAMGMLGAGIFISLMLGLKRPKISDATDTSGDEAGTPESPGEK